MNTYEFTTWNQKKAYYRTRIDSMKKAMEILHVSNIAENQVKLKIKEYND